MREELATLNARHGATLLVSVIGKSERDALGLSGLEEGCHVNGMELRQLELDVTNAWRDHSLVPTLEAIERTLDVAKVSGTAVVHCANGLERAPAFAAACLVARGMAPDEAIARVRALRAGLLRSPFVAPWLHRIAAELR